MPLKRELLPYLANSDPITARIGACNTLRTGADGKLYGFNTDVAGSSGHWKKRLKLKDARIAVLGAAARRGGRLWPRGAGRGGLHRQPHPRKRRKAGQGVQAKALKHDQLSKNRFDVLINSTPCGMAAASSRYPSQRMN